MAFSSADRWKINELRIKRIHSLTTETFIKYNLCSVRALPPHSAGAAETQLMIQLLLINFWQMLTEITDFWVRFNSLHHYYNLSTLSSV